MALTKVFSSIDQQLDNLTRSNKLPACIVINTQLYKKAQVEVLQQDVSAATVVRNPIDLRVYKGVNIYASDKIKEVEVF